MTTKCFEVPCRANLVFNATFDRFKQDARQPLARQPLQVSNTDRLMNVHFDAQADASSKCEC